MSIEVESLKVGVWWCDVVLFLGVRRLESLVV